MLSALEFIIAILRLANWGMTANGSHVCNPYEPTIFTENQPTTLPT